VSQAASISATAFAASASRRAAPVAILHGPRKWMLAGITGRWHHH
jgi:hypothetical protein